MEGLDKDGMDPHSSMYHNLIANNPKYFIECPEFLFPQNDPKLTGYECYPSAEYNLGYLQNFCDHFELNKFIEYNSYVEWVEYNESEQKFHVTVRNTSDSNKEKVLEVFDYVIVATGHFSEPNIVQPYPGQETFPGQIMHSKYYMDANRFTGLLSNILFRLISQLKFFRHELQIILCQEKATHQIITSNFLHNVAYHNKEFEFCH